MLRCFVLYKCDAMKMYWKKSMMIQDDNRNEEKFEITIRVVVKG